MRTVGRKVIFYGLLIANIDKDIVEYSHFGVLFQRDQQSALYHVLQ